MLNESALYCYIWIMSSIAFLMLNLLIYLLNLFALIWAYPSISSTFINKIFELDFWMFILFSNSY